MGVYFEPFWVELRKETLSLRSYLTNVVTLYAVTVHSSSKMLGDQPNLLNL